MIQNDSLIILIITSVIGCEYTQVFFLNQQGRVRCKRISMMCHSMDLHILPNLCSLLLNGFLDFAF